MKWQDQSEVLTLPAPGVLLERLSPEDGRRLLDLDRALPRVVVAGSCLRSMREHLATSHEERGGLLVGRAYHGAQDGEAHIILAERSVASEVFDSTGVSLRMESEIWSRTRPLLAAGAMVVGWYHSHPDLGAFFSDTDRATQRSFFRNPFSVGIVIDPIRDEMRAFVGADSVRVPEENLIVVDGP
ncbi:MAG: Mov34/MPN/PAD-1 family protein [Rhodospirillaceae bacterium]